MNVAEHCVTLEEAKGPWAVLRPPLSGPKFQNPAHNTALQNLVDSTVGSRIVFSSPLLRLRVSESGTSSPDVDGLSLWRFRQEMSRDVRQVT